MPTSISVGIGQPALLFILIVSLMAGESTFYIDPQTGDDAAAGSTPVAPWRTLRRAQEVPLGSSVLLRRNAIFREQLRPASGTKGFPVRYAAYGTGAKPLLLGSLAMGRTEDWIDNGGGMWRCATDLSMDAGNIYFRIPSKMEVGHKRWRKADLVADGDFWCDREEWRRSGKVPLWMYARVNPAWLHPGAEIEVAIRSHIVDYQHAHDIVFEDLSLSHGGAHGFGGGNTQRIVIRRCDISWIGGGDLDGKRSIRFGNGIEFWGDACDHLVEECRIWNIYDTALTNQSHGQAVVQRAIVYRNNVIWNCGMASLEIWTRPAASRIEDIVFSGNTCVDAGYGWAGGPDQRPVAHGAHLCLWGNEGSLNRITFIGNIFCRARQTLIYQDPCWRLADAVICNRNCFWQIDNGLLFRCGPNLHLGMTRFADYRQATGYDSASKIVEPQFVAPADGDFRLLPASPSRPTGTDDILRPSSRSSR